MKNYKGLENEEEFTNILLDESLLEEDTEVFHINDLHSSLNPKFFPKEINEKKSIFTKSKDAFNSELLLKSSYVFIFL